MTEHLWEAFTGIGTLTLAVATFWMIINDRAKEKRQYTPLITFDFYDIASHENIGAPGFRNIASTSPHPTLLINGAIRNISETSAVDCKLDIFYYNAPGSGVPPVNEIHAINLHSGLGSGEHVEVQKAITINDLNTQGSKYFSVGISGLFSASVPFGSEYPFEIVFSFKNAFGDPFFTVYAMKMDGLPGKAKPITTFKGSFSGTYSKNSRRFSNTATSPEIQRLAV